MECFHYSIFLSLSPCCNRSQEDTLNLPVPRERIRPSLAPSGTACWPRAARLTCPSPAEAKQPPQHEIPSFHFPSPLAPTAMAQEPSARAGSSRNPSPAPDSSYLLPLSRASSVPACVGSAQCVPILLHRAGPAQLLQTPARSSPDAVTALPCGCSSSPPQTQGTCDPASMSWWLPATQFTFLTLFSRQSFHLTFSGMLPKGVTLILA